VHIKNFSENRKIFSADAGCNDHSSHVHRHGRDISSNSGTMCTAQRFKRRLNLFAGVLVMLRHVDRAVTALGLVTSILFTDALVTTALSNKAWAAPPRGGAPAMHAAAAPHPMAAPHVAAPAAHIAAPAPHFSAPARVATPRVSAPARNFAASRAAAPRFAAQRRAEIARGHVTQSAPRFAATPRFAAQRRAESARANAAQKIANRPGETTGLSRQTQNQGSEKNLSTSTIGRARIAEARRAPILRNPVFAGQPSATSLSRWTFRGHFAQSDWARDRHHHRHLGVVLGFAGLLFWPYAYDDFLDYTYAPYAYDTFWPYAYDDVYAGIYGGYAPEYYVPEDAYAYAGSAASEQSYSRSSTAGGTAAPSGETARICSGQAQGLTNFSIQKIAQQIDPDQHQQALLNDLKAATIKAVNILQAACPSELPSTPTGRLAAMRTRVDAMLQAVQTVRPALEKFYQSLNDEQRERFNAVDQGEQAQAQPSNIDRLCRSQSNQGRLPIERIQRTLHLSPAQDDGLKTLDDATVKAGEILQARCQPTQTLTPTGRLSAMEQRLSAMSQALQETQSALNKFYGSLSDEQKAQFDRINARAS
jgi:hypothetical protein